MGQRLFVIKSHIPNAQILNKSFPLLPTLDNRLIESVIWKYYATKCRDKILRGTLWKFNKQKRASSRQKVPGRKISAQKLSEIRSGDIGLAPAPFSNPGTPNLSHGNNMKSWPVFVTAKKQTWFFCQNLKHLTLYSVQNRKGIEYANDDDDDKWCRRWRR